jgi:tetratricopeptide (TPR) repeat protein
MRITLLAAAFIVSIAAPVCAQVVPNESPCDQAWDTSDWSGVASACGKAADAKAADAAFMAKHATTRADIENAAIILGTAGVYAAREALGYEKLGRNDTFASVRNDAVNGLTAAIKTLQTFGKPDEVARLVALLTLLQLPDFPSVAPASELLASTPSSGASRPVSECSSLADAAANDMFGMSVDSEPWLKAAECYFNGRDWQRAITLYVKIGRNLITDPNLYVTQYWHLGLAYAALGRMHDARAALIDADNEYSSASDLGGEVDHSVAAGMLRDYARLGAKRSQDQTIAAKIKSDEQKTAQANREYAKNFAGEERQLVENRGIPCHIETYVGENGYHTETFWYCDDDGTYDDAYTFTNGHLTSEYAP